MDIVSSDMFGLLDFTDQFKDSGDTFLFTEAEIRWYEGIQLTYIEPFDVTIDTIYAGVNLLGVPPERGTQMADWYMGLGDTAPKIRGNLTQNGQNVDLTNATVVFKMRRNAVMIVDEAAVIVDEDSGLVEYGWGEYDTALPGLHEAWFVVTWDDDTEQSFPNKGLVTIQIEG